MPFARSGCATPNPLNFPRIDILEFWSAYDKNRDQNLWRPFIEYFLPGRAAAAAAASMRACAAAHACVIDTVYQLSFLLVGADPAGLENRIFV